MTGKAVPGRYAQDADGAWHLFTDKAALGFKPVAVVTVKVPPVVEPDPVPAPAPTAIVTIQRPEGGHVGLVIGDGMGAAVEAVVASVRTKPAPRIAKRRVLPDRRQSRANAEQAYRDLGDTTRTATPGDVFRAIGEQFGILPAIGAQVSTARFKPLIKRNEDEDAARAYAGAVEDKTGHN